MQRVWPIAFHLSGLSRPLAFPAAIGAGFPITPLLRSNADMAQEYYCGRFEFSGVEVTAGVEGILDVDPPNEAWTRAFHGFAWLASLESSGLELHRMYA